uniref:Uncharacterized protein n=1 Tax=Human betaherpesvirus 6 TaxID=10368 RepID=A0A5P9U3Q1_9BETA|nr:hypothetical protein [Human betaherpesvirus 6]
MRKTGNAVALLTAFRVLIRMGKKNFNRGTH